MPYDIRLLKLLARGGQADIYEIDKERILRVIRDAGPNEARMLRREFNLMAALYHSGAPVPKVYEFIEDDDLIAMSMQRINGKSMLQAMGKNLLKMKRTAKELARLHCEVSRCPMIAELERHQGDDPPVHAKKRKAQR